MTDLDTNQTTPSVAEVVRTQREALGLSQQDVAEQLFLTPTFIRYLDTGDFDRFPKQAFVRGYLRSYARVLGLDADAVVRQFDQEVLPATEVDAVSELSASVRANRFSGPVVASGVIGLLVILILVAVVWTFLPESQPSPSPRAASITGEAAVTELVSPDVVPGIPPSDLATKDSDEMGLGGFVLPVESGLSVDEGSPSSGIVTDKADDDLALEAPPESRSRVSVVEDGLGAAESRSEVPAAEAMLEEARAGPSEVRAGAQALSLVGDEVDSIGADRRQLSEPMRFRLGEMSGRAGPVSITREILPSGRVIEVDAGGRDRLVAKLQADCWIEVADANQALIYGDLNRSGDTLVLRGVAPLTVLLGNAPAVTLAFNDRPVDLASQTSQELTARVILNN